MPSSRRSSFRLRLIPLLAGHLLLALPLAAQEGAPCGRMLYMRHCVQCHGTSGRGDGELARLLDPPPRNFATGRFQLVSAANGVPTLADVEATLERGMPGSAMPSFRHLPSAWRRSLADYVLGLSERLYAEDLRASLADEEEGEELEASVAEALAARFRPGPPVALPGPPAVPADPVRVRSLYEQSCADCHGPEGRGDGTREMRDELGRPARPRDFRGAVFQGGGDAEALYRRIVLGMPGSAMPATDLAPADALALARYVQELAGPPVQPPAPAALAPARRDRLPVRPDEWASLPVVALPLQPLAMGRDPAPVARLRLARTGAALAVQVEWELTEGIPDPGQATAAIGLCDWQDPPYFSTFEGGAFDFLRLPARPILGGARPRSGRGTDGEGGTTYRAVLRRLLAPGGGQTVDLRSGAGTRWFQLMLIVPTPEGPALAFSPWVRLES